MNTGVIIRIERTAHIDSLLAIALRRLLFSISGIYIPEILNIYELLTFIQHLKKGETIQMSKKRNLNKKVIKMPAPEKINPNTTKFLEVQYIGPKHLRFSNNEDIFVGHIVDIEVQNDDQKIVAGKDLIVADIFGGSLILNQKDKCVKGWNNVDISKVINIKVVDREKEERISENRVPFDKQYIKALFKSYGSSMSKFSASIGSGAGYLGSAKTIAVSRLKEISKLLGVEPGTLIRLDSAPLKLENGEFHMQFRGSFVDVYVPSLTAALNKITVLHITDEASGQYCLKDGKLVKIWLDVGNLLMYKEKLIAA